MAAWRHLFAYSIPQNVLGLHLIRNYHDRARIKLICHVLFKMYLIFGPYAIAVNRNQQASLPPQHSFDESQLTHGTFLLIWTSPIKGCEP